jgi:hypothetical protein
MNPMYQLNQMFLQLMYLMNQLYPKYPPNQLNQSNHYFLFHR